MNLKFYSLICTGCRKNVVDIMAGGNHITLDHNCTGNRRLYTIYHGIKTRCNNKKSNKYTSYGKRGIKCEWISYEEFYEDMHQSYLEHCKKYGEFNTTIDRINTFGNYSKKNCRWATMKVQNNNSRKNKYFIYKGEAKTINEWSRLYNIPTSTLYARTHKLKWDIKKAIETPINVTMIPFAYR